MLTVIGVLFYGAVCLVAGFYLLIELTRPATNMYAALVAGLLIVSGASWVITILGAEPGHAYLGTTPVVRHVFLVAASYWLVCHR